MMTSEIKSRGEAGAFMSNLIPVLGLFVLGYPLGRATIRTMLIGWVMIIVALTRLIFSHYFQIAGRTAAGRTAPTSSTGRGRYRQRFIGKLWKSEMDNGRHNGQTDPAEMRL